MDTMKPRRTRRKKYEIGHRFAQFVLVEYLDAGRGTVLARCDCGSVKEVYLRNLVSGLTVNCTDRSKHVDPRQKREVWGSKCSVCDGEVPNDRLRFCSPECLNTANCRKRWLLQSGVKIQPWQRQEVFERDGWICQLCMKRVPKGLLFPDPLYPTVDHRVPLAMGGSHHADNWQTAHFICNSRKGHRG